MKGTYNFQFPKQTFVKVLLKIFIFTFIIICAVQYCCHFQFLQSTAPQSLPVLPIGSKLRYKSYNSKSYIEKISPFELCSENNRKAVFVRRGYSGDPDCTNFVKCLYEDGTFDQTPLVSFPGSGNTWTRHLIELASGIYTGSIYTDVELLSRGFAGEKEPADVGSTIVQKMHINFSNDLNVSKAILIIRNPYKSIVSFVQYLESGHLGLASFNTFRNKEWPIYVLKKTYEWISIAKSWIESPVDLLVLHYENLQDEAQVFGELTKVCNFLQIKCQNLNTACFWNHKEGLFHRGGKAFPQPRFPNWVRKKVDAGINFLSMLLGKHGHSKLPLAKYEYTTGIRSNKRRKHVRSVDFGDNSVTISCKKFQLSPVERMEKVQS